MSKIKTCVSLYSLQTEYLRGRMSLKDILEYVKSLGCEGVEILPDQMIIGAPEPSPEILAHWRDCIMETGLTPVIADVFLNTNLYKNRNLTRLECIKLLIKEIKQAHALGIRMIRLVSMVPYWVCEPLLPYCEKYDVTIALEVHAAMAFDIPETRAFVEEMKRLNSPYVGLVIDTGIFCRRFPRIVKRYEINNGASPELFEYVDGLFAKGTDLHAVRNANGGETPAELKAVIKNEEDAMFAPLCDGYENLSCSVLDDVMPYVRHIHFKMFEMTDEGPEYSMDYMEILKYLHEHDYNGYVSTEYEGNRFTLPGTPLQEKEQVRRNQKYVQSCLAQIQGQEA